MSSLNIATIYDLIQNPSSDLRRASLMERFDEVGYMVEFRPRYSRGTVWFRSRHQFRAEDCLLLWDLLKKRTGKEVPLDTGGRLPYRKIYFAGPPKSDTGYTEYLPSVNAAGILEMQSSWGEFELEVYAAEAFATDCASWLAARHAEKWKWVCIEVTKLNANEYC